MDALGSQLGEMVSKDVDEAQGCGRIVWQILGSYNWTFTA